jgi:multidrug resistance efflux pump
MNSVTVRFDGSSREYNYLCPFEVRKGDRVIVDTPSSGYTTVTVVEFYPNARVGSASKQVVATIDDEDFKARQAKAKEVAEIKKELKQIEEQIKERNRLAAIAAQSPQAQLLFDRLAALGEV